MNTTLKIFLIALFCLNYSIGYGQIEFTEYKSKPYYKKLGNFKKEFTFNRMSLVHNWLKKNNFDNVVSFIAQDKVVGIGNTNIKTENCDLIVTYDFIVSISHEKYEIKIENIKTILFNDGENYKNILYYKDFAKVISETTANNNKKYSEQILTKSAILIPAKITDSEKNNFDLNCLNSKQGIDQIYKILSKEYNSITKELNSYLKEIQKF
jgi:hypothetical protein